MLDSPPQVASQGIEAAKLLRHASILRVQNLLLLFVAGLQKLTGTGLPLGNGHGNLMATKLAVAGYSRGGRVAGNVYAGEAVEPPVNLCDRDVDANRRTDSRHVSDVC